MAEEIFHVITKSWMSDVSCDVYNFLNFPGSSRFFFARKSAVVFPKQIGRHIYKVTRMAEGDEGNSPWFGFLVLVSSVVCEFLSSIFCKKEKVR